MKTKQTKTKITQSKNNLEKHIQGARKAGSGHWLLGEVEVQRALWHHASQGWGWVGSQSGQRKPRQMQGPSVPRERLSGHDYIYSMSLPSLLSSNLKSVICWNRLVSPASYFRFLASSKNLGTFALMPPAPVPTFSNTYPSSYHVISFDENDSNSSTVHWDSPLRRQILVNILPKPNWKGKPSLLKALAGFFYNRPDALQAQAGRSRISGTTVD